jgi:chorismate mutase
MKDVLKQIEDLRDEIDILDEKLLDLLAERAKTVQKIGRLKRGSRMEPFDKKRWQKMMRLRLLKSKSLGLSFAYIKKLYKVIHEHSLELQKS